ncbi:MAG TPA: hypothetical protein VGR97_04970 [Candidatus Acidoferrales bacterium]|nr:hypothetical protein [Candidatus Acidoferrales bacterium]
MRNARQYTERYRFAPVPPAAQMCGIVKRSRLLLFIFAAMASLAMPGCVLAQFGFPPPQPPVNARKIAPLDLTGYWVSIVTEDWRFRMITPDKGDYASVPLNSEGKRVADMWDPAKDEAAGEQCRSYGAPAIMRVPGRLHISWENDNTLRVETDAGTQTRIFHFDSPPPPKSTPQWQGYSVAEWDGLRPGGFFNLSGFGAAAGPGGPGPEGYLKVVTTELRPGYLRKNGVPYSLNAKLEEYFDSFKAPNGDQWLVVTTIVTDPKYLAEPFITSSHFKKLPDASGWNPSPCATK